MKFFRCYLPLSIGLLAVTPAAVRAADTGPWNAAVFIQTAPGISNACDRVLGLLLPVLGDLRTGDEGSIYVASWDGSLIPIYEGPVGSPDVAPDAAVQAILENLNATNGIAQSTDTIDLLGDLLGTLDGKFDGRISDVYLLSPFQPSYRSEEDFFGGITAEDAAKVTALSGDLNALGANFHIIRIGRTNADPVLEKLLSADTVYASADTDPGQLTESLVRTLDCLEVTTRSRIGQFRREKRITLTIRSRFPQSTAFTLRGVTLHDVRLGTVSVLTDSANLLPAARSFYLKPGQATNVAVTLFPVGNLRTGRYTARMQWAFDSHVDALPGSVKVTFKVGGLWWLWLSVAFVFVVFKYYFKKAFRALEKSKAGAIAVPFRKFYRNLYYRMEDFRRRHPRLTGTVERLSESVDNLSLRIVQFVKDVARVIWQAVRIAGIAVIKVVSRFILFFPLGFVLEKAGSAMLKLNSRIGDIRIPKWKKNVSLKVDLKKVTKIRE